MANNIAFLGLGSNLGDREDCINRAIFLLAQHPGIHIEKTSSLYETQPVGYTAQPDFLNAVIKISTTLSPECLLAVCLSVEHKLGRMREIHWGPRSIDIDILLYDQLVINTEDLLLPHPYLHKRKFVLIPLLEIAPDILVYHELTPGELLSDLQDDNSLVRLYKTMNDGD